MFLKWIPWRFLIQRAARAYGVLDPLTWLARMRRFAQPSEVSEPLDLVRAGIAFHARGLINTRAIQHNLDWIWPYWVERQFKPGDNSFIPRAFSLSHINLTHRNWTAVGLPDLPLYPIVDPRGLVTPLYDGWSIDAWIVNPGGNRLLPSRMPDVDQRLDLSGGGWVVETGLRKGPMQLASKVRVEYVGGVPTLVIDFRGETDQTGWLILSVRPYNPEGIHFVHHLARDNPHSLLVNSKTSVVLDPTPVKTIFSTYAHGDVFQHLDDAKPEDQAVQCPVGMATAAAFYRLEDKQAGRVRVTVELAEEHQSLAGKRRITVGRQTWRRSLASAARLELPDRTFQYLYDAAVRTLVLLSAGEIVPGPYTYRRFWYRDAVMMLNAMLRLNLADRCADRIERFFDRQQVSGYFESQEGEWDSNGQVLWVFDRFERTLPRRFDPRWMPGIIKGAQWIRKKRLTRESGLRAGLLPAGFSAEHLGPNDYYYWDDFWSIAGLYGAGRLAQKFADGKTSRTLLETARNLEEATFRSISGIPPRRARGAIPAAPYRRMDAGAVGSLAADYPLQLTPVHDARILATVQYLMDHCFFKGGFFQDMIHSGINAYLTLAIAQTLLRNGDLRYRALMRTVADLASGTGQWPEAVHPATLGGCMGDGHHGWAAAEWVNMIGNCFVREENEHLVIGSGLFEQWLVPGQRLFFGPACTRHGSLSVEINVEEGDCTVECRHHWVGKAPRVTVRIPGFEEREMTAPALRLRRR